jgi:outer membrane protein
VELLIMGAVRRRAWLLAGLALVAAPAQADDLREALALAYRTNPDIQAARANQRATDENVPIARAASLPNASLQSNYTENLTASDDPTAFEPARQFSNNASLSVPIYAGGSVRNQIRAAETRVVAGRADVRATESAIFSQVVAAYMDVIRGQALVGLNRSNVQVLEVNLEATSDRFEIGDLTRTDLAQSESRLALARGDVRSAEANLIGARERYIQVVGKPPVELQPPPPLPNLPSTADEAVAVAIENNPDLIGARERSRAADIDIDIAGAGRLPRVEAVIGGNYTNFLGSLPSVGAIANDQSTSGANVGVRATIPLFQGGRPAAQERQAQARAASTLETEIAIERDVISQTRAAYASWRAANEIIDSTQIAVDAAALSLEGVRAENSVGNRTILDILDAEQELLRARVQLVTARRDAYVAGFSLLAAMGRAEARDLGLETAGPLYDPEVNYERVRGKIWDWGKDPDPLAQGTRTVDTPAQDGSIPPQ